MRTRVVGATGRILARTFVVDSEPTDLQQSIFDHIAAVQQSVPCLLKHGARGTQIWRTLDEHIREHPVLADKGLVHHAGHGIGIRMHETHDLNRDREGILQVGDVVCVEPGGYTPAAQYGVRIENTYLITESGCENLSEYPGKHRARRTLNPDLSPLNIRMKNNGERLHAESAA